MAKKESKRNVRNAALFKIISECNDFCSFCLEYKFIKSGRPPLSFVEFKRNYFYLKKKFNPDYVILTGGEPTLHPQFFEILEFLKERGEPFRIITNLLKFNENDFLKRLKLIFSNFKNKRQKNLSKIIASINNLPEKSPIAQKRFNGLKNALELNLPLMVTTVIYRQNLKFLPQLVKRLVALFQKYSSRTPLSLEMRLIYIEGTMPLLLKKSLPKDFRKVKVAVEESIQIINKSRANLLFWNFPLCYLDNPWEVVNNKIAERQCRQLVKVHKDAQMEKAEMRNWEIYLKPHPVCRRCKLNTVCSGIDGAYIKKYHFPKLKPIL